MRTPTRTVELHQDQESSSFATALRSAIAASGLGLERLQQRLARRGVALSVATLSYWQSGRTQPGRSASLAAVRHLEEVLGLPVGELAGHLGPPRPRGRWAGHCAEGLGLEQLWEDYPQVAGVLNPIASPWEDRLTRLSQHDRYEIGPDRTERRAWIRQVMRADAAGPDRCVMIYRRDEPGPSLPGVRPISGCQLGRIRTDPAHGYLTTELLFDRPLARGETVVMEYEVVHHRPYPVSNTCHRKFRFPVREYVIELQFTPPALPARCWQYAAPNGIEEPERARELTLDSEGRTHAVALNFGPGEYGLRWAW